MCKRVGGQDIQTWHTCKWVVGQGVRQARRSRAYGMVQAVGTRFLQGSLSSSQAGAMTPSSSRPVKGLNPKSPQQTGEGPKP